MTVEETETKTMKEEKVTLGSELIYPTASKQDWDANVFEFEPTSQKKLSNLETPSLIFTAPSLIGISLF
jgi:hypothetical protein